MTTRVGSMKAPLSAFNMLKTLAILAIIVTVSISVIMPIIALPHEDAAILYSYSRNLADTGVISYYPGGERAEGATDFGWMISIALLQKIGIANHFSTGILNASFLGLFAYRLRSLRHRLALAVDKLNVYLGISAFCFILIFSGSGVAGFGGFSTIAQMSLLGVIFSSCLFQRYDILFLLSSVYFVLLRPDSIAYYTIIVASFYCFRRALRENVVAFNISIAMPVVIFLVYWPLRAFYFQNAFPLPFYVKQATGSTAPAAYIRLIGKEIVNPYNLFSFTIIAVVSIILLLVAQKFASIANESSTIMHGSHFGSKNLGHDPHELSFFYPGLLTCVAFFAFQSGYLSRFVLMQNIADRFHAPFLGLSASLLSCFLLLYSDRLPSPGYRNSASLVLIFFLFAVSIQSTINFRSVAGEYKGLLLSRRIDNITPLAVDLGQLHAEKGISKMYVTEAGKLTYYSRIPTIDAWGLNTPDFAKVPLIEASSIINSRPDIISMHVDYSNLRLGSEVDESISQEKSLPLQLNLPAQPRDWDRMTQAMYDGGRALGYATFVVPFNKSSAKAGRHDLYMVSPASPVRKEIENILVAHQGKLIVDQRQLREFAF
jgi:hypothetical protein